MKNRVKNNKNITRRDFIAKTSAAAAFMIVPRFVLGGKGYIAPSDKLNIAAIGVGGKGRTDIASISSENIVALCDVDDSKMAESITFADKWAAKKGLPNNPLTKLPKYKDFRVMLEKQNDIDAVTVSTPDHSHAVAAMASIQLGKHAFVQKPLTHSVDEAYKLSRAAKESGVITQMGNQGHAGEGIRLISEWIDDGAIGQITEVQCWTNRPIWDQGIPRPTDKQPTPSTLDWNLWLGPAPLRDYHSSYAPFSWRAWCDFGTGALGDMGAHIFDIPYHVLKMEHPNSVYATSTKFNGESWPVASTVYYEFPKRKSGLKFPKKKWLPPVKLTWYDGGIMPPRPEGIEPGRIMGDKNGGVLFLGDKGMIMCGCYGSNPRLVPETSMKNYNRPKKTIPRSPGIHEEWIECIKTGNQPTANFDYAAKLTGTMLLGNIAVRMAGMNKKLKWDSENLQFSNLDEANRFLSRKYRDGWAL